MPILMLSHIKAKGIFYIQFEMFNFPEGACPHPPEMALLKSIEAQINHKRLLPGSCLINEPRMAVSVRSLVSRYKY